MTRTLILAEKRSLAEDVAAWLSKTLKVAGRKVGSSHISVGDYDVSWLSGHVLENWEPHDYDMRYKKWNASDLPFIPQAWRLRPKQKKGTGSPDPYAMSRIKDVTALLKMSSTVIGLGDPDDEGQLLQDEFLIWAGWKGPTKRLWLNATDDATIASAWKGMKDNKEYEGHYWAALARSHADFLAGINGSRACTLAAQAHGSQALLTWGRVQTPTLALIVRREIELRDFKPVDFYVPKIFLNTAPAFNARWLPKDSDERLDLEGRLVNKKIADGIAAAAIAEGSATVVSATKRAGKEQNPLLFSLSKLQGIMSKKYGIGAAETLELAQSLYQKKIASYPRTDAEYMHDSQHAEAENIVDCIRGAALKELGGTPGKADTTIKSRAFDSKALAGSGHHAITPRPFNDSQIAGLTSNERKLFIEICKRYLLQFFPVAEFSATEVVLACGGEQYSSKGKSYTLRGWKDAFSSEDGDDEDDDKAVMPVMKKGDRLPLASATADVSKTKPPKRFTSESLLNALKNIHHFVIDAKYKAILKENIGIGTEATRAGIISELIKKGYIENIGRDTFKPTELGEQLIQALPIQMTAPDLSAMWQQAMSDIKTTKEPGYAEFMATQAKWLDELIRDVPGWFVGKTFKGGGSSTPRPLSASVKTRPTKEVCLKCKAALNNIEGKFGWFFACSGCKEIYKDVSGKPVARTVAPTGVKIGDHASGDACPKCGKGTLALRTCGPATKTPGKKFLSCSNFGAAGADKCTHAIWPK